jgi:plastocyanin
MLTALHIASAGCGGSSGPAGPSPQTPPPAAAPTVGAITPGVGTTAGGQSVTITGTGFTSGASVSIGGAPATGVSVTSATSIAAMTPARGAGQADVVVTNPDGQSGRLSNGFTFNAPASPAPSVTAAAPSSGPVGGGTAVTITGTGFAAGANVSFGAAVASAVNVASDTSIVATAPAGNAGAVDLVVTNPDGQSARLTGGYTYVASAPPPPPPPPSPVAPTVTGVSPSSGTTAGGIAVTITGTGFAAGATVSFGGSAATGVVVSSATSITATTPAHAAGAVDVVVTNSDGQNGRLAGGFTYNAPAPPPATVVVVTITSAGVSPSTITISPGTRVRFVNNDVVAHDMTSDPHPSHTQCPEINAAGLVLGGGQSKDTAAFNTVKTCGYHDHNDSDNPRWSGTIIVR